MSISRPQPGWDLYVVMNVTMLSVQLCLHRLRLIPLGSYFVTASKKGQSHVVQQLAPWGLWWRAFLQEKWWTSGTRIAVGHNPGIRPLLAAPKPLCSHGQFYWKQERAVSRYLWEVTLSPYKVILLLTLFPVLCILSCDIYFITGSLYLVNPSSCLQFQ